MAYDQMTIALKTWGNVVVIDGFCGVDVNLDQVKASIEQYETHLTPSRDMRNTHSGWEKGTLIIPDNDALKGVNAREREQWARHIESGGYTPPPGYGADDGFHRQWKVLAKAKTLYGQMSRHMRIAEIMVERQQMFLKSGNWMDKQYLTISELAECLHEWGEKTVRDSVHSLRFSFAGTTFPADTLICASELPAVCKKLVCFMDQESGSGAPRLTHLLNEQGVQVSQRLVGKALQLLAETNVLVPTHVRH